MLCYLLDLIALYATTLNHLLISLAFSDTSEFISLIPKVLFSMSWMLPKKSDGQGLRDLPPRRHREPSRESMASRHSDLRSRSGRGRSSDRREQEPDRRGQSGHQPQGRAAGSSRRCTCGWSETAVTRS